MAGTHESIETVLSRALAALATAADAKTAEAVWREYAGKRGILRTRLRTIGRLPPHERAREGSAIHRAIATFETAAQQRLATLKEEEHEHVLRHERIDVTIPVKAFRRGTLHPLTMVRREAQNIFLSLGFSVAEGPEVEDVWHNFDALNIPDEHPARDVWDTFWLKSRNDAELHPRGANAERRKAIPRGSALGSRRAGVQRGSALLLRTHTSPVQIRYMEAHEPPFRIIAPGRVYRYEATDASHDMEFWQLEGLMVDHRDAREPVTMATLLSILEAFFTRFFKKAVALRVRPSYFPFVEPGIEVDLSCIVCNGNGCSVCRQSGWVEMLGAGMVHPNVFDAVKYNPKDVQGFAFGFGLDRLAMLKYRIPDIRLFRYGDLRFLQQFR